MNDSTPYKFVSKAAGAVVLAVLLLLGATACGSSTTKSSTSTPGSSSSGASTDTIIIKNFAFNPPVDTVKPGATITVTNKDSVTHTLTGTSGGQGDFNTGDVGPGQTKTFTAPTKPGSYPYFCMIHNFMTGTLNVS